MKKGVRAKSTNKNIPTPDFTNAFCKWLITYAIPFSDKNQENKYQLSNKEGLLKKISRDIKFIILFIYGSYAGSNMGDRTVYNVPIDDLFDVFNDDIAEQLTINLLSTRVMISQFFSFPNRFLPGVDKQFTLQQCKRNFFSWHHEDSNCPEKFVNYMVIKPVVMTIINFLSVIVGTIKNSFKLFTELLPFFFCYLCCIGYVNFERDLSKVIMALFYSVLKLIFISGRCMTSPFNSMQIAFYTGKQVRTTFSVLLAMLSLLLSTVLYLTLAPTLLKTFISYILNPIEGFIENSSSIEEQITPFKEFIENSLFIEETTPSIFDINSARHGLIIMVFLVISCLINKYCDKGINEWHLFSRKRIKTQNKGKPSSPTTNPSTTGQETISTKHQSTVPTKASNELGAR